MLARGRPRLGGDSEGGGFLLRLWRRNLHFDRSFLILQELVMAKIYICPSAYAESVRFRTNQTVVIQFLILLYLPLGDLLNPKHFPLLCVGWQLDI